MQQEDYTSLNIFSLLEKLYEAIKDFKYLSWWQDLQIAGSTITAAGATYGMSHDWKYVIFASLGTFAVHTTAMYQEGIQSKKQQAIENDAVKKVEAKGNSEIKDAQTKTPSKNQVDDYINSMEH